jgi:hypothetical protein
VSDSRIACDASEAKSPRVLGLHNVSCLLHMYTFESALTSHSKLMHRYVLLD